MARPLRIQYPGAYYHLTCRGNDKKNIFLDDRDREIFLDTLSRSLQIYNVILHAFVCMPNHFHLLAHTPDGNLSEFMRHFNISYTAAFNRRHQRVGHLYQGRFKAFLIEADKYMLAVSRYIHLNPIRTKAMEGKPAREKWQILMKNKWSSLPGYLSAEKRGKNMDYGKVLGYVGGDTSTGMELYRKFLAETLEAEVENPFKAGMGHGIVGGADFVDWVKGRHVKKGSVQREQPAVRALKKGVKPEEIIGAIAKLFGKGREEICRKGSRSLERAILMELLYRFCNTTQLEIGKLVGGIDYSAVSLARKRLRDRLDKHADARKKFDEIVKQVDQLSSLKI